jgi:MYXO-CTERM domain-containing protein
VGWGIRGNYGHETGAMIPGALAAMAVALLSGRTDWHRRVAYFGFFGALGWSFGGSISYMQVIGYTHSGHSLSVWYGFASLFVIGFLWAAMGGAGTALPAVLNRQQLTEFFPPLTAIFGAWWGQSLVEAAIETHASDFRQENPLYWYDTDWLGILVAMGAVLALAACRRRLDPASKLVLYMGVGWWAGFLLLVVGLGLRMTPPRGDNWAGCLGAVAGMFLFFQRHQWGAVAWASLTAGLIGGLGFAGATMLKLVEVTSGAQTNWHSVLEQTYGLFNGLGIAWAMSRLIREAPVQTDTPPAGERPIRRWTEIYVVAFVLLAIPYFNLKKNPEQWVKAEAMPAVLYGLSADTWYHLGFGLLALAVLALLFAHQRRPLALAPATWLGRGQLLYLALLGFVLTGNFERIVVNFQPERLVTEGTLHLNGVLCGLLVLLAPPRQETLVEPMHGSKYGPILRRTLIAGFVATLLAVTAFWGAVRAIYGDRHAGHSKLHIRFGPNATTEEPKPGQPHP